MIVLAGEPWTAVLFLALPMVVAFVGCVGIGVFVVRRMPRVDVEESNENRAETKADRAA